MLSQAQEYAEQLNSDFKVRTGFEGKRTASGIEKWFHTNRTVPANNRYSEKRPNLQTNKPFKQTQPLSQPPNSNPSALHNLLSYDTREQLECYCGL